MIDIKSAPNANVILSAIVLGIVASAAQAAPVGPLTTFSAGTPAKASQVNGNFTTIVNTVNANDTRLTTVETNKQNIVTGNCASGSAIRAIAANGTVTCQSTGGSVGFVSVNSISAVPISPTTSTAACFLFCSPIGRYQTAPTGIGFLFAPITLPHGATITAFSFTCFCNDGAGSLAILLRDDTSIASATIAQASSTVQAQSTTTITAGTEVVDNQNHTYIVLWETNGTAGSNIIPVNATVTYKLP